MKVFLPNGGSVPNPRLGLGPKVANWKLASAIQRSAGKRQPILQDAQERSTFGCGLPALRCIADLQSAGFRTRPHEDIFVSAEYNSAIRQIENLRYVIGVAPVCTKPARQLDRNRYGRLL